MSEALQQLHEPEAVVGRIVNHTSSHYGGTLSRGDIANIETLIGPQDGLLLEFAPFILLLLPVRAGGVQR